MAKLLLLFLSAAKHLIFYLIFASPAIPAGSRRKKLFLFMLSTIFLIGMGVEMWMIWAC
ncbi:hypothetical protein [Enterococcus sp. AZ128]|uniref:hypothetical protein n=1 Tax=unclassified Enterococcus TaxID=2608891 RepID=UPI003F687421